MKIQKIKFILLILAIILTASYNFLAFAQNSASTSTDIKQDTDQDGLTDVEEKTYGTNPNNSDSDGDSYSDGTEIKSGYNPLVPSPGDKIINSKGQEISNAKSLTSELNTSLQSFLQSKEGQNISSTDLQNFVDEKLGEKIGDPITFDTLPQIDTSIIKIKKLPSGLSERDSIAKEREYVAEYFEKLIFLLLNNSPVPISNEAEFNNAKDLFSEKLLNLQSSQPDYDFFRDLGNKLEIFYNQTLEIEVPENLYESHVRMLRLIRGYLSLKDPELPSIEDPVTRIIIFSKLKSLTELSSDLFNQVGQYMNYLKSN